MNKKQKEAVIQAGMAGFGIGTLLTLFVLGPRINELEKKNKTAFELHKQMIRETQADLNDVVMPSGEFKKRLIDRLNFITMTKTI